MNSNYQDKQIMEAIKSAGIKNTDWIKSLTEGIAFSLIGIGFMIITLLVTRCCLYDVYDGFPNVYASMGLLIAIIFLAFGTAGILRGILQKKAVQALPLNTNQGS
jgi:hypothetical protein